MVWTKQKQKILRRDSNPEYFRRRLHALYGYFPRIPHSLCPSFMPLTLMHSSHELHLKESIFGNFNKLYLTRLYDMVLLHDPMECEVKWALGSITTNRASGSDGIPVELLQILKDDAVKVLHSICQQIWKTQQWPQDWKRSVFIPILKKGKAKECSNYHTIALISNTSEVMLKILEVRLQQYVNGEF